MVTVKEVKNAVLERFLALHEYLKENIDMSNVNEFIQLWLSLCVIAKNRDEFSNGGLLGNVPPLEKGLLDLLLGPIEFLFANWESIEAPMSGVPKKPIGQTVSVLL